MLKELGILKVANSRARAFFMYIQCIFSSSIIEVSDQLSDIVTSYV